MGENRDPEVSIIIPTLNEEATIEKLIESINSDPYPKEVMVVDGGSVDRTKEIVKSKGARAIKETGKKKCPANARNIGAENTNSEVLCFLDGDVEYVGEGFLSKTMKHFKRSDVVGVRCEREIIEDSLVEKVMRSLRNSSIIKYVERKESKGFEHMNFIRREVFEDIGGFPLLGFGEDRIFWNKLKNYLEKNGGEIVYEPNSKFFQHRPHTFEEVFNQSEWYGRTAIPYVRKRLPGLMEISSIFAPLIYVTSAVLIFLIPLHPMFLILGIPFLARIALAIVNSLKSKSRNSLLIPILDLVRGCGFAKGFCSYVFGSKRLGR